VKAGGAAASASRFSPRRQPEHTATAWNEAVTASVSFTIKTAQPDPSAVRPSTATVAETGTSLDSPSQPPAIATFPEGQDAVD